MARAMLIGRTVGLTAASALSFVRAHSHGVSFRKVSLEFHTRTRHKHEHTNKLKGIAHENLLVWIWRAGGQGDREAHGNKQ